MKDKKYKHSIFQDCDYSSSEQEDIKALSDYYGVKIKTRQKKPAKFSERKEKDLLPI